MNAPAYFLESFACLLCYIFWYENYQFFMTGKSADGIAQDECRDCICIVDYNGEPGDAFAWYLFLIAHILSETSF